MSDVSTCIQHNVPACEGELGTVRRLLLDGTKLGRILPSKTRYWNIEGSTYRGIRDLRSHSVNRCKLVPEQYVSGSSYRNITTARTDHLIIVVGVPA